MRVIFVAIVAALLAAAIALGQRSVQYTSCSSNNCRPDTCQSQEFAQGDCLSIQGKPQASATLTCGKDGAQMCSRAQLFSDSKCTDRAAVIDSVCNTCNNQRQIACGALFDATFFVQNCTAGTDCNDCPPPTITPYKKCKNYAPNSYVEIWSPEKCTDVNLNIYPNSTQCQGGSIQQKYWSGRCNQGVSVQCVSNSTASLRPKKAITLPAHLLQRIA